MKQEASNSRTQLIQFVVEGEHFSVATRGSLSMREILWGLEQFKLQLLTGQLEDRRPLIPGMLKGDGKRVPS